MNCRTVSLLVCSLSVSILAVRVGNNPRGSFVVVQRYQDLLTILCSAFADHAGASWPPYSHALLLWGSKCIKLILVGVLSHQAGLVPEACSIASAFDAVQCSQSYGSKLAELEARQAAITQLRQQQGAGALDAAPPPIASAPGMTDPQPTAAQPPSVPHSATSAQPTTAAASSSQAASAGMPLLYWCRIQGMNYGCRMQRGECNLWHRTCMQANASSQGIF